MQKKRVILALGLGILAALLWAWPTLGQTPAPAQLVRIDVFGSEDLGRVEASGLPILAHLTAPTNDFLLGVLSAGEMERLQALGLPWRVLDDDATGAQYYLVKSGQLEQVQRASAHITLFYDDGFQMIVRLRPGASLRAIDALGLAMIPVGPDPIVLLPKPRGAIPTAALYDPLVAEAMARITETVLAGHVADLSGERPVLVGGEPYLLRTRYSLSGRPLEKATQYVYEYLQARGYRASYHAFPLWGAILRNVVGEKLGRAHPERVVLLTAHLDSRSVAEPHDPAPGADDNASGCAALLAAADALQGVDLAYTVRLVFFTGEEQGMWGSYYYARDVANAGEDILGVINLDMIAWDAKMGPDMDLHSHLPGYENDSDALARLLAAVVETYDLALQPQIVENGTKFSDHARFWERGYAAILGIEDYYNDQERAGEPRDWNPNYHSVYDRLSTLNLGYFREYARASLATLIHLATPMRTLSGTITAADSGAPLLAQVQASGREETFVGAADTSGRYALALPSGYYTVTISAEGYRPLTITSLAMVTGTGKTLDVALAPVMTPTPTATETPTVTRIPTYNPYPVPATPTLTPVVWLPLVLKAWSGFAPTITPTYTPAGTIAPATLPAAARKS